jgi:hypothetical protein
LISETVDMHQKNKRTAGAGQPEGMGSREAVGD